MYLRFIRPWSWNAFGFEAVPGRIDRLTVKIVLHASPETAEDVDTIF